MARLVLPPFARLARLGIVICTVAWSTSPSSHAQHKSSEFTFEQVEMVPLSALQLGDAALVSPKVLHALGVELGQTAELSTAEHRVEVLLYAIDRPKQQISIGKSLRDRLEVKPGKALVTLRLMSNRESKLKPQETQIRIEAHEGSPDRWPGIVLGAPHGDCDMYTGEIVEAVSKKSLVPAVCAYGSRISFLGRWIDVNRPLQRRPNPGTYGILPYRDWTEEASSIFANFKKEVLRVGTQVDALERSVPLSLYLDFHGHDLTVKDEQGKDIYRNVFECMARGFSVEEVVALKAHFDECVKAEYGDEAPPSYWGNLQQDRQYEFAGYPAEFYYSGLGGRVYGILASNVASRAIHIESPNSVRIEESQRPRTARVLANYLGILRDELLQPSLERQTLEPPWEPGKAEKKWASVPAGEFLMGAPEGEGWSIERPQHWVELASFEIATTEVTCGEYMTFVNHALSTGRAVLRDRSVFDKSSGKLWCVLWPQEDLSLLEEKDGRVTWREGRQHHPVNCVTWYGAVMMAQANDARLPTEAQWERSAGWDSTLRRWHRTGISLPQFGPIVDASLMNSGHISENYVMPSTCPVGSFSDSKSPVGCYDMSGNVWEWTNDWLANYPNANGTRYEPTGPDSGTMKAIRGGSWDTERSTATPSFRLGVSPDQALPNVGFRLAR